MLEYLYQNGFRIKDVVYRQNEISSEFRGDIYIYLIFGVEDQDEGVYREDIGIYEIVYKYMGWEYAEQG